MACQFELFFRAGQYSNDTEAAVAALDLVEKTEGQLSYFRPHSQLSRLNLLAADGPVEVGKELFDLVTLAMDLYRQTDGALDITSAPLWEAWGFARRGGRVPTKQELADALRHVGSDQIELDPARKTIRFKQPGVRLNLGSLGKGYALDQAAAVLAAAEIADFLFHGGQSSVLARGSSGGGSGLRVQGSGCEEGRRGEREQGRRGDREKETEGPPSPLLPFSPAPLLGSPATCGWSVGVRHPLRPDHRLGEIRLRDRSLGTSGSTFQFFRHQGHRYGHILDPKTGMPAEGVLAATVVAPSATLADALSTAFFVMGPERTAEFCKSRREIAALVVCPTHGHGFEVHSFGFRDELVWSEGG
jgi:thiamine biosynthesis lipoprotein